MEKTSAENVTNYIKQAIVSHGLDMPYARAQSNDGARAMRGRVAGAATRILSEYPKATFSYCAGHGLNLVVQDTVSSDMNLMEIQEVVRRASNFVKYSRRRKAAFETFAKECENERSVSLRPLCATRWVLRAPAVSALVQMYGPFLDWLAEVVADNTYGTDVRTQARRLIKILQKFRTLYGLKPLERFFNSIHHVHVAVQRPDASVQSVRQMIEELALTLVANNDAEKAKVRCYCCLCNSADSR